MIIKSTTHIPLGPWKKILKDGLYFVSEESEQLDVLYKEVKRLREALESARIVIDEMECRDDEDCDHCQVIYRIINPALKAGVRDE